jgi:prolycopene isomerase
MKALEIEKDIEFIPLEQGYHVHFPDFDYKMYSGGPDARKRFVDQLIGLFPHEEQGIRGFFETLVKIYDQSSYATFLGTRPKDIARILRNCPTLVRHIGKGIMPFVNDYVKNPKLRAVLSINSTCANMPPSKISILAIAGLLIEGGLSNPHVVGGPQAVSEAFAKCVCGKGGEVVLGHMVDRIIVKNGKACGIETIVSPLAQEGGGMPVQEQRQRIRAKYVISSAAARQTFKNLVGEEYVGRRFIEKLERMEPTPPFCALFLGLDMDLRKRGFEPALHIHTSTYDTDAHFRNVGAKLLDEAGPTSFFRFQFAPLSDPTSAPKGKTAFVMHNIPAPVKHWENPEWQKKVASLMIKRAESLIPDLSQHIEYQELATPHIIDRYTLCGRDASIGWACTPEQIGPKRLANKTPVENLFLAGHWTAPAIGVLAAVISGLTASKLILRKEGVAEPLIDMDIKDGLLV